MLEHQEALEKIFKFSKTLPISQVPLEMALGQVLSKDLRASFPLPSFDNSAVDGYALRFPVCHSEPGKIGGAKNLRTRSFASLPQLKRRRASMMTNNFTLKVAGEIAAGAKNPPKLIPGTAAQIFTGAPVPAGTEAVVMQEKCARENGRVQFSGAPVPLENIRFKGEDIQKGELLLNKGTVLGAAQIGLLAAAGYAKVPVIRKPQVTVLATGNELKKPGEKIKSGQIFDSNTPLLRALLEENACAVSALPSGRDSRAALQRKIRQGLKADVFLIAGGVSVGKYDLVKELLREAGVREIFWKVNIKPGKPLFFGRKGKTLVFGLPGNPVSVFVTFSEYVKPCLQKLQGKAAHAVFEKAKMAADFKNGPRRHFVRCVVEQGTAAPLAGQGSHMIRSLAQANAILEVPPNEYLPKNREVTVKLFGEPLPRSLSHSVVAIHELPLQKAVQKH